MVPTFSCYREDTQAVIPGDCSTAEASLQRVGLAIFTIITLHEFMVYKE